MFAIMFRRTTVSNVVQGIIMGCVLVYSDSDLLIAYGLAKQIQLMPLNYKC
jgi:hypothetical protein